MSWRDEIVEEIHAQLPEDAKHLDREAVRAVLTAIEAAGYALGDNRGPVYKLQDYPPRD